MESHINKAIDNNLENKKIKNEEARQKRKDKMKKKKKNLKLDKQIICIRNMDKTHTEKWNETKRKNIANFPNPTRFVLIGPPGRGKTNIVKNLIMQQNPPFDRVYLVHPDVNIGNEYLDMDLTDQWDDFPPLDFWEEGDKFVKTALIIDDYEYSKMSKEALRNLATLFRFISSHRQITIYLCHQSFIDIPIIVKKVADVYIIWKPRSYMEINIIENRTGLKKNTLKELFKTIATGFRDFIVVDNTENSPAKLRLNLFEPIVPHNSSGDDEEDDKEEDDKEEDDEDKE